MSADRDDQRSGRLLYLLRCYCTRVSIRVYAFYNRSGSRHRAPDPFKRELIHRNSIRYRTKESAIHAGSLRSYTSIKNVARVPQAMDTDGPIDPRRLEFGAQRFRSISYSNGSERSSIKWTVSIGVQ